MYAYPSAAIEPLQFSALRSTFLMGNHQPRLTRCITFRMCNRQLRSNRYSIFHRCNCHAIEMLQSSAISMCRMRNRQPSSNHCITFRMCNRQPQLNRYIIFRVCNRQRRPNRVSFEVLFFTCVTVSHHRTVTSHFACVTISRDRTVSVLSCWYVPHL